MSRARKALVLVALFATVGGLVFAEPRGTPAALWPSALAVGLAFLTRDIYLSLFLGAFSGAFLLHHGNPWRAFHDLLGERLTVVLTDPWNARVLVFTVLMGGFVGVLNWSGGMAALSNRLLGARHHPRRVGLAAYGLGWLLFIDGLANAMLVGKTLRPAADRAGMSREKLAFIVDSTSAPIAGLALISTWVAYEMSVIREGFLNAGEAVAGQAAAPFTWLLTSLPYRFYNWFLLWLVFLVVWTRRDWGAMRTAEQAQRSERITGEPRSGTQDSTESPAWLALIPIGVLVTGVFGGLFLDGGGLDQPLTWTGFAAALGQADAAGVFVLVTALSILLALVLPWVYSVSVRGRKGGEGADRAAPRRTDSPEGRGGGGVRAMMHGMQQMFLPALILVFAWLLNSVLKELGAAAFLVGWLGDSLPGAGMPALVFVLSAAVSFSTGTSWGTMAIVMPLAIPLAASALGPQIEGGMPPALVATVGAVLAGAVFGDHCSPISDTTIVSAFSCDCDVMAHVRTQLPYAAVAAVLAVALGYAPAGFGLSPMLCVPLGAVACWLVLRGTARTPVEPPAWPAVPDRLKAARQRSEPA